MSIANRLFEKYDLYKEQSLSKRRYSPNKIYELLDAFRSDERFEITEAGKSVERRPINLLKIGQGKIKVLMWSQMHGDEATATMALMDMLNFFAAKDDFDNFRKEIFSAITLYIIPVLNPDGTERFQRRNALNADLNRDADKLEFPESQVLKKVRDETNADFGFNLHDQNIRYTVGDSRQPATISWLAPAYNFEKSINEGRLRAMQLIALLDKQLKPFLPNQSSKYNDDFESRAFGDNIQKWGTSTILVESGGYQNDREKMFIRKLNFVILLSALESIATKSYEEETKENYFAIPENGKKLYDLIIRDAAVSLGGKSSYLMDIGFNRYEVTLPNKEFYYDSKIEDLGNMSTFFGYQEFDAKGFSVVLGKTYPTSFSTVEALRKEDLKSLLKQGFTNFLVDELPKEKHTDLPVFIVKEAEAEKLNIEKNPPLLLIKSDEVKYVVINGFLCDLEGELSVIENSLRK